MVGNDPGGRPEGVQPRKNAKIAEVVKVNNYQFSLSKREKIYKYSTGNIF
jgi:hypothetical protein